MGNKKSTNANVSVKQPSEATVTQPKPQQESMEITIEKLMQNLDVERNIIFIDVDGVLNNANSDIGNLYVTEPALLELLLQIIIMTNGILVLSSTWRYAETSRGKFIKALADNNLPCFVSCIPNLKINRTDEILVWLKDNTTYFDGTVAFPQSLASLSVEQSLYHDEFPMDLIQLPGKIKVKNFIAIDDMDLMKEGTNTDLLKGHFVLVDKKVGLTDVNVTQAIELFGI